MILSVAILVVADLAIRFGLAKGQNIILATSTAALVLSAALIVILDGAFALVGWVAYGIFTFLHLNDFKKF